MRVKCEEGFGAHMIRHFLTISITIIAVFAFVWTALMLMWLNIDVSLINQATLSLTTR